MRALVVAAAVLFLALPAARAAGLPPELAEYEKEGEKWFQEAGRTDTPDSQRNEARKKALINLKKALDILNDYGDAHPAEQAGIEDRTMKVGQMFFWAKKESPVSVLEDAGLAPKRAAPLTPAPPPTPPVGGNPPAPSGGPPPAGNPFDKPMAPPPRDVEKTPAPTVTIEKSFAEAEAYAKSHRADVPGIMERYQAVMARFPESTGHPLYLKAAERAGQANLSLKDLYRKIRDDDPNSVKGSESEDVKRTILLLGRDLDSQDASIRERSAKLLGMLGSDDAIYPLSKAMKKETEAQALGAHGDAVVAIGGRKAVEALAKLRDEKDLGVRALDLLQKMTTRNAVDRRLAIKQVGGFALAKDDGVASKAVDFLVGLGADGAQGLVEALDTNRVEVRLKVIPALGATRNPEVARPLSNFLIGGDIPNTVACRNAAVAAIKTLGDACVPYLFHGLRNGSTKMYTGDLLRQITGKMFSSSRPGDWINWYKSEHPDWKDDGK